MTIQQYKRSQERYLRTLSASVKKHIRSYTHIAYIDINKYLRKADSYPDPHIADDILALKTAIENSPPLQGRLTVYRAVNRQRTLGRGDTFTNKGFVSTSLNKNKAVQYMKASCCLFKIQLKKGAQALFIEPLSQNIADEEILLPMGVKFHVIKTERFDKGTLVTVECENCTMNNPFAIRKLEWVDSWGVYAMSFYK